MVAIISRFHRPEGLAYNLGVGKDARREMKETKNKVESSIQQPVSQVTVTWNGIFKFLPCDVLSFLNDEESSTGYPFSGRRILSRRHLLGYGQAIPMSRSKKVKKLEPLRSSLTAVKKKKGNLDSVFRIKIPWLENSRFRASMIFRPLGHGF